MTHPEVTILIPNYRTLEVTKLCLRLLRKHTDEERIRVIVVDNDSRDESVRYLRSLRWIRLIERSTAEDANYVLAHSAALDRALEEVTTPYVLSFHTDTLVIRPDWLDFLLKEFRKNPNVAGVGSWKLENKSLWKRAAKKVETGYQSLLYPLLGKGYGRLEGKGDNFLYLRSHCAMYRMDLIRKYGLFFADGDGLAGREMHRKLIEYGHEMVFFRAEELNRHVVHLNHATGVLNPRSGTRRETVAKGRKRIDRFFRAIQVRQILLEERWDH